MLSLLSLGEAGLDLLTEFMLLFKSFSIYLLNISYGGLIPDSLSHEYYTIESSDMPISYVILYSTGDNRFRIVWNCRQSTRNDMQIGVSKYNICSSFDKIRPF